MPTWITIALIASAACGAVLIALGLRGRRLDRNPICRRCGFDLQGRFPWSQPTTPTCPDCGERLLTFRSVMPGARARRASLMALGLMLCFPGLVLLLAEAADTFAGRATASVKTSAMIANQVSGNTKGSAALRVLTGRTATGGALAGDLQPAIERALVLQADRSQDLDPQWLELLETARRRGLLSPNQQERYFKAAIDWRLLSTTGIDTRVPFAVQAFADRLAASPTDAPLFITVEYTSGRLDGKPLRFGGTNDPYSTPLRAGPLTPGTLVEIVDQAGHNADPGPSQPLAFELNVQICKGAANGAPLAAWVQTLDTNTGVEPSGPRTQMSKTEEAAALGRLSQALAVEAVELSRDSAAACWASFTLKPSALSHDIVALLRITTGDGQTYESTTPVTITPSDQRWTFISAADPSRSPWKIRVQLDGAPGMGKATVELAPYPAAHLHALVPQVWAGDPIRFENVELKWAEPPKP